MIKVKTSKKSSVSKIYNPITSTYYKVRVKNTSAGAKGTIIGKWSSKK